MGSASRARFPASLTNHVGFTHWLLYSSTPHSPECFLRLKIGRAQDAWLQWSYENWYYHHDNSRWLINDDDGPNFDALFIPDHGTHVIGGARPQWFATPTLWRPTLFQSIRFQLPQLSDMSWHSVPAKLWDFLHQPSADMLVEKFVDAVESVNQIRVICW